MSSVDLLSTKDKILDISVNLARVSDWIFSDNLKRQARIDQFLDEIKKYLATIQKNKLSERFKPTFHDFEKEFGKLLRDRSTEDKYDWAERALTWANILQHRAKLA